jgi:hypothetical protein
VLTPPELTGWKTRPAKLPHAERATLGMSGPPFYLRLAESCHALAECVRYYSREGQNMPDNQQWVEQLSRDVELLSSKIHTLELHQARFGPGSGTPAQSDSRWA